MAQQIQVGDVVILKSGGPTMTVEATNSERVHTQWFDATTLKSGSFNAPSLKLYTPEDEVF